MRVWAEQTRKGHKGACVPDSGQDIRHLRALLKFYLSDAGLADEPMPLDRPTDRRTDRSTHRPAYRPTDRPTDRPTLSKTTKTNDRPIKKYDPHCVRRWFKLKKTTDRPTLSKKKKA